MFTGKESSNRIELSRCVFWAPCGSGGEGWGHGGGWGTPTHVHMHTHACMHMHAHACMVNMIISCKWLPPLGEFLGIPYDDVICACTCMCVHAYAHVWGTPYPNPHTPPPPSTHPSPQGGTPGITQNSIVLELKKIFQFCLKI